jgi:hypothetical protein
MSFPVCLEPDKHQDVVTVNNKMQIWQLIIQIGKKFGMRVNEFEIITNSGPLSDKIYS